MAGVTGDPGSGESMDMEQFLDDFVASMDSWETAEGDDDPR